MPETKWFFHNAQNNPDANAFLSGEVCSGETLGLCVLHHDKMCADGKTRDLWEGRYYDNDVKKVFGANKKYGYGIKVFLETGGNLPRYFPDPSKYKSKKIQKGKIQTGGGKPFTIPLK